MDASEIERAHRSEEWRPFPSGWENLYEISSLGRVRRIRERSGYPIQRVMSPHKAGAGYLAITLKDKKTNRIQTFNIHRVVCRAFHGDPPTPNHHAAHRDGVKTNNAVSNLRWLTKAENEAEKFIHGTVLRGERCPSAKLTDVQVAEIRARYIPGAVRIVDLGNEYGVRFQTIYSIVSGKSRNAAR